MSFSILSLSAILCYAQENYNMGARSNAMANASLTLNDAFSPTNNVGAIGNVEHTSASVTYQNRYNIPEFMVLGASLVHTSSLITTGLNFYRFGNDLYSEQKAGVSIGNKIQMMSLGAGINIIQQRIEGLGAWRYLVIEFGGVATLTEQLLIGAHIFNINVDNTLPITMKAGLSYRPVKGVMINLEAHKSMESKMQVVSGIEYYITENLVCRTGLSTRPFRNAFGLGVMIKKFGFNYSLSNQSDIGSIHEVSVDFSLNPK